MTMTCNFCGTPFEQRSGRGRPKNYCNAHCRKAAQAMNDLTDSLANVSFPSSEQVSLFRGNMQSLVNVAVNGKKVAA
jgi:hypothetical protein